MRLPQEVRTYFRWCNGFKFEREWLKLFPEEGFPLSLEEAMQEYHVLREVDAESWVEIEPAEPAETDPYALVHRSQFWSEAWFPLFSDGAGGFLACICAGSEGPTAPIYKVSESDLLLTYDSLTSLLLTVVTAYETGAYTLVHRDYDAYPIHVEKDWVKVLPLIKTYNPRRTVYLMQLAGGVQTQADLVASLASPDHEVSTKAWSELRHLGDARAVPLLARHLHNPDPEIRTRAASVLGEMRHPDAVDPLLTALQDDDPRVRAIVVRALREINDPVAADALWAVADTVDKSSYIGIMTFLAEWQDARALNPLLRVLETIDSTYRSDEARALGRLGDPRAVPALIRALDDESTDMQLETAGALGEIADPRALDPLLRLAEKPDRSAHHVLTRVIQEAVARIRAQQT